MTQVFAAILMFTFFAISGLVVDLGVVRLEQRQMNTPTDAASLEGMRLQDSASEFDRRTAVRELMLMHWDDDFQLAPNAYQVGSGPVVSLTGGTGPLQAGQQVSFVPRANIHLNMGNLPHGDMVRGYFNRFDLQHAESLTYARSDFGPVAQNATDAESFLVRMRRTNDPLGLDRIAGVSGGNPPVPYLFARGSTIAGELRAEGVTVRSTSVAAARPVTLAGVPYLSLGLGGTTPFLLEYDYWAGITTNSTFTLQFTPATTGGGANPAGGPPQQNPNPTQGGPPIIPPGQLTGPGLQPTAVFADRYSEARTAWSIGDPVWVDLNFDETLVLQRLGNPQSAGYAPTTFVVPIYEGDVSWFYDGRPGNSNPPFLPPVNNVPKDDIDPRVIGFGLLEVISAELVTTNNGNGNGVTVNRVLTLRKLPGRVWPTNVSAVATPGLADLPAWLAEQITGLNGTVSEGASAAALAR